MAGHDVMLQHHEAPYLKQRGNFDGAIIVDCNDSLKWIISANIDVAISCLHDVAMHLLLLYELGFPSQRAMGFLLSIIKS